MNIDELSLYCTPTFFIDSDHEKIIAFSSRHAGPSENPVKKAVSIYYAVRDQIRYDPYDIPNCQEDSVFHPFDAKGQRHMAYIEDHGHFDDLPWSRLMEAYQTAYPRYFESDRISGDFNAEAKGLHPK